MSNTKVHPTFCKCRRCKSNKKDKKFIKKIYFTIITFIVTLCIIT